MKSAYVMVCIIVCACLNMAMAFPAAIDLELTVSDGAGGTQQLHYGLDMTATDGIDASLGETELPPSPPSGIFDARFIGDDISISIGQGLLRDYRQGSSSTTGTRIHELRYQVGTGTSILINWNMPSGVTGRLQDILTGTLIDVAMSGSGSYTVTNPGGFNKLKMTVSYTGSSQAVPTVLTQAASGITTSGAVLNGTVNPNGAATSYYFEYGLTNLYGTSTATASAGSGTSAVPVSATLTSLSSGTLYHYRLVASNSAGAGHGDDMTFTTSTSGGSNIDLLLTVSDGAGGTQQLHYGLDMTATDGIDASLGETELPPSPPSGIFDARFIGDDISISIGQGLLRDYRQGSSSTTGTRIHELRYQVGTGTSILISWNMPSGVTGRLQDILTGTLIDVAMSGSGSYTVTNPGGFNKLKMTVSYTGSSQAVPTVLTQAASGITTSGAVLNGTVNPNGAATSYYFEYGLTNLYGTSTATASAGSGTSAVPVSATLISLSSGTLYHYRLVASNSAGAGHGDDMTFTTSSGNLPPWGNPSNTGYNATIAVPAEINPTLDGVALKSGDAIGAFFLRDGTPVCGGYCIWSAGQSGVITAYGDDETTALKDGFSEGELINYKIWDSTSGTDWNANATYQMGGPNYTTNGIMALASLAGFTFTTQNIVLPSGWSMISSYVAPQNPSLTTMMADIVSQLTLMKNGSGQVYWPAFSINTIGNWNYRHGYQIHMKSPMTLVVTGTQLQPEGVTLSLAQGWNLISYLRNNTMLIQTALSSIAGSMLLTKNGLGQVYWPAYSINTIGSMKPGQGYQMYLTQASTLIYPANTLPKEVIAEGTSLPPSVHFTGNKHLTGSNAVFVWRDLPFADGDEIAVFTSQDQLVGSGVMHNSQALLTVWGDDAATEMKDGAGAEEVLSLRRWSRNENTETKLLPARITDAITGQIVSDGIRYVQDGAYLLEGVSDCAADMAEEYELAQNYPNPFNPTTKIKFKLPKTERLKLAIYNTKGECVRLLFDETAARGIHCLMWNGMDDIGRIVTGGIYFLRISCDSYDKVVKMSLIK